MDLEKRATVTMKMVVVVVVVSLYIFSYAAHAVINDPVDERGV